MADFINTRNQIDSKVYKNGRGAITGEILNGVLQKMVTLTSEVDTESKGRDTVLTGTLTTQGDKIQNLENNTQIKAFDASEILLAITEHRNIQETFVTEFRTALAENRLLFIRGNGTIHFITHVTDKGKLDITAVSGRDTYNYTIGTDLSVSLTIHTIGVDIHLFNNENSVNILNLEVGSTSQEIQEVFTDAFGDVVIPHTGDIFNIYQNADVTNSGIVASSVEDAGGIRLAVDMSNFEDNLVHRVFYNLSYRPSQGLDSLSITNKVDNVINPSLLTEDKVTARDAEIGKKANKTYVDEHNNTQDQLLSSHSDNLEKNNHDIKELAKTRDRGGFISALSLNAEREITICDYPLVVRGHGTPSKDNMEDERMKALEGSPAFIGQLYINLDVTSGGLYYAVGANSVSDWKNA